MADTDISKFLAGLKRGGAEQIARATLAVDVFGQMVLGNAQDRAPVDKGDLKASATDLPAEFDGNTLTKTIGFNKEYAAIVHEDLEAHHDQGEAKYLEKAIRDLTPKFAPFVAGRVKGNG